MVHGKIKAYLSPQCVDTMLVGETAYLSDTNIVLTLRTLYLDRHTPVIRKEEAERSEEEGGMDGNLIKITRVGSGVTENDFVLDFTDYKGEFEVEPLAIAFHTEKDVGSCIAFTGFNISLTTRESTLQDQSIDYSLLSLEELEKLKNKALKKEDYLEARKICDAIEKMSHQ